MSKKERYQEIIWRVIEDALHQDKNLTSEGMEEIKEVLSRNNIDFKIAEELSKGE